MSKTDITGPVTTQQDLAVQGQVLQLLAGALLGFPPE